MIFIINRLLLFITYFKSNKLKTQVKTQHLIVFIVSFVLAGSYQEAVAQKKNITLEDIWSKGTFAQKTVQSINWMKDGAYYTALEANHIVKHQVVTGAAVETLFDESVMVEHFGSKFDIADYVLSADEQKILITTQPEAIYRRSTKVESYVYDIPTKQLAKLSAGGKQLFPTFSPDGTKIAFVRQNNIYLVDLATMTERAITTDGKWNNIINGAADWVYEEEFGFAKAFQWSPDSQKLAYYTFDESKVPEYNMQMWGKLYPTDYRYKYPKAGENNAVVSISVFHLATNQVIKVDVGAEPNKYIPRMRWTKDSNVLAVVRLNRTQNRMELLHADALTGNTQTILVEESHTYVDVENLGDDLKYLADGKHFIMSSEKTGFKHLYLYDIQGHEIRQLTNGKWEVATFYGIDERTNTLYYTSTEISPTERHLYSLMLDGTNNRRLSPERGMNSANFSPDFQYFVLSNSSANSPLRVSMYQANTGQLIKVLEDNTELRTRLQGFNTTIKEFTVIRTADGIELNTWMIKPNNFNPNQKYPLLMFVYGGPGSQQVLNQYDSGNFFWYQYLAQKGYIVACVDNRGTGGRGTEFKKCTYLNLGKLEVNDQIQAAKYFGNLPYIDKTRIGIQGWSYGGFMASNCLFQGADVFKAAIAVAPVTNWRYYDTIYTERFLRTPQENPQGYDDNSPVTHAAKLKGNLLLVHGTGDDNVHFQNAVALEDALIKANKQFQTFYYPNKNHGISGGNTRLHLYTMMTNFLEKNL